MTDKKFVHAIGIIRKSRNAKVEFNKIIDGESTHDLVLVESNATVVEELIAEGFVLYPRPYGVLIDHFDVG